MAQINLKKFISRKDIKTIIDKFIDSMDSFVNIVDVEEHVLAGKECADTGRKHCIGNNSEIIGWVNGGEHASLLALTLTHLAEKESLNNDLADEVLSRYKEIIMMYNISEKISGNLNLKKVEQIIIDEAMNLNNVDNGSIWRMNDKTGILEIVAAFGKENANKVVIHAGEGVAGYVYVSGNPEIINDVKNDPRYIDGENEIYSMLCAPLKTKNSTIGVIIVSCEKEINYTAANLKFFYALASQGAIAIENTQYMEELNKHRKHLEVLVEERTNDLAEKNVILQKQLDEIKTLKGLLPICANCKKIRNDGGYWDEIEQYFYVNSDLEFTHSICPDCVRELYPDHAERILRRSKE